MTILMILVLLATVIVLVQFLVSAIKSVVKAIVSAPGKGVKKLFNFFKGFKLNRENSKLEKALLEADRQARLNAAKHNPNYRAYPKVKKILLKQEIRNNKKNK